MHVRVHNRKEEIRESCASTRAYEVQTEQVFHIVMREEESRDRTKVWFIESVRHSIKIRLQEALPSQTA